MEKGQKGLSLMGLILISILIVAAAIVVIKLTPSVIEYFTIEKSIETIANNNLGTETEIRHAFDQQAIMDQTSSVTGADLDVVKQGGGYVISFAYAKKIPLAGNVSILIDFAGSSGNSGRRRID